MTKFVVDTAPSIEKNTFIRNSYKFWTNFKRKREEIVLERNCLFVFENLRGNWTMPEKWKSYTVSYKNIPRYLYNFCENRRKRLILAFYHYRILNLWFSNHSLKNMTFRFFFKSLNNSPNLSLILLFQFPYSLRKYILSTFCMYVVLLLFSEFQYNHTIFCKIYFTK